MNTRYIVEVGGAGIWRRVCSVESLEWAIETANGLEASGESLVRVVRWEVIKHTQAAGIEPCP